MNLSEEAASALRRAFSHLSSQLNDDGKLRMKSVVAAFLNLKANPRYEYLSNSCIRSDQFPRNVIDELEAVGLIRTTDKVGAYALTCKGVLAADSGSRGDAIEVILSEIDAKFFKEVFTVKAGGRQLRERYRFVLLALIALRVYSQTAALRLNRADGEGKSLEIVRAAVEEIFALLKNSDSVSCDDVSEIFGNSGVDHPVLNLFRHTDEMKRSTRGMFSAPGDSTFCLDLVEKGKVSANKLGWLLWLVFRDQLTPELFKRFSELSRRLTYDKAIHLYDDLSLSFASPSYDSLLKEAYSAYLENRIAWESGTA